MEGGLSEVTYNTPHQQDTYSHDDDQRVYFVPYKWWKEAKDSCSACDSENKGGVLYKAVQAPSFGGPLKIFNSMFYSDLMFNLNRDDCLQNNENSEVGTSVRDYALVSGDMWLEALKWYSSRNATKDGKNYSDDEMSDVYPIQLRLTILQETNSLGVKISKKDNAIDRFRRASKIFNPETDSLHIWDFAGKTTFLSNKESDAAIDTQSQPEHEILLELQIYGLSDFSSSGDAKNEDRTGGFPKGRLSAMNGGTNSISVRGHQRGSSVGSGESGSLGLTGLQNLGNTCFMNSALQCLIHTPKIIDYFLGDYCLEINHNNPLGMDGEIALAFGDLLRKLWAPGATAVAPRVFKSKLARFAPQFSGFNQHDSQELLAFLLDGLHEDLNRVKCKPYSEVKDGNGRPDEEVADEYWHNHLARNDSIIVDVCQGQYRSTLVCPVCQKVSVTFDPFMYLSLPLPSTTTRRMTLTVISSDGGTAPSPFTVTVPKHGKFEDLIDALTTACSLGIDETLLVAEIYNCHMLRYQREPKDSLSLIRDEDRLVAYRLPKSADNVRSVLFTHQHAEEICVAGKLTSSWKAFGIPLLASSRLSNGYDICNIYLQSLGTFGIPGEQFVNTYKIEKPAENDATDIEDDSTPKLVGGATFGNGDQVDKNSVAKLEFYLTDEKGIVRNEITINGLIEATVLHEQLNVLVRWPATMFEKYESRLCSSLPPVFKSDFFAKRPQDSVTLYKCLEGFLKEEPLGPEDMWFCPSCKKHCQASKKLDLWRLPEILVIHLKRFSYNRSLKNKLDIYVDFPVHDLDLSKYISYDNGQSSNRYMLYAISNHYGSMGGGHYTAFVRENKTIIIEKIIEFNRRHTMVSDPGSKPSQTFKEIHSYSVKVVDGFPF